MSVTVAVIVLVLCFAVLAKCAGWFVDGAVGIADHFHVPKMLIGIVLVSLATTAPELAVSVMSAMSGAAEIALGNAIGSVIVDDTVAIGLAAMVASAPIVVNPGLLKTTGLFLIAVDLIAYYLVWDGELSRAEGAVLLVLEAMKMEHQLVAHASGVVSEVRVKVGQMVDPDEVLVVLEAADGSS